MQQAWARDIDRLGFLRRQEGRVGQWFGAYYWHDDRTRVRLFAQDSEEGPQLLTEWREWPIVLDHHPRQDEVIRRQGEGNRQPVSGKPGTAKVNSRG